MTVTSKPLPILHTIQTGGSGTGHGYYSRFASGCPLAASLDFSSTENSMEEKSGRNLGTIAHAMHELRWRKVLGQDLNLAAVEFSQHVDEENRVGAERVVRYFNEVLPEDDALGEVLEIEAQYPQNDKQKKVMDALYDVPFTFRADLITRLDKKQVARLLKNGSVQMSGLVKLQPGKTLWDYKHYGRRESNLIDKAQGSTQYASYTHAYNKLYPKDPIVQTVQVSIFTTKEIDIWMTVIPIDEHLQRVARQLIIMGAFRAESRPLNTVPNENNCFPYGGLCKHLKESKCDRFGPTNLGLAQLKKAGVTS